MYRLFPRLKARLSYLDYSYETIEAEVRRYIQLQELLQLNLQINWYCLAY